MARRVFTSQAKFSQHLRQAKAKGLKITSIETTFGGMPGEKKKFRRAVVVTKKRGPSLTGRS